MTLLATMTPPARKTETPLPYWPSPPEAFLMSLMRLPETCVPSSPPDERQTWTPLTPLRSTRLSAMTRPVDSV